MRTEVRVQLRKAGRGSQYLCSLEMQGTVYTMRCIYKYMRFRDVNVNAVNLDIVQD